MTDTKLQTQEKKDMVIQIQTFKFVGDYQKKIKNKASGITRYEPVHVDVNIRCFLDEKNNVWFVGRDVCDALGIGNITDTFSKIKDEFKGIDKIEDRNKGIQSMLVCNEDGLIDIIWSSNKPIAEDFKTWCRGIIKNELRKKIFNHPIQKDKDYYEDKRKKLQLETYDIAYKLFERANDHVWMKTALDKAKNTLENKTVNNVPAIEDKRELLSLTDYLDEYYQKLHNSSVINKWFYSNRYRKKMSFGSLVKEEYKRIRGKDPILTTRYVNGKKIKAFKGKNTGVAVYSPEDYRDFIHALFVEYEFIQN